MMCFSPTAVAYAEQADKYAISSEWPEQQPYEDLETVPLSVTRSGLNHMLNGAGWSRDGISIPTIAPPLPWQHTDRSFSFHIHAWDFISLLLHGFEKFNDDAYLRACLLAAKDWIANFATSDTIISQVDQAREHIGTMAWYDMAVGQRSYRLAYLIDVGARRGLLSLAEQRTFLQTLTAHLELLARDDFFVGHTNHGLYQAFGQLASARRMSHLPGFSLYEDQARERLRIMFDRSFFPSGAHREHSPGYHYMILGSMYGAHRSNMLDAELSARLQTAKELLLWMVEPSGSLATFGDTDFKKRTRYLDVQFDPQDANLPLGIQVVPDAGYAFARYRHQHNGDASLSYIAQLAGFHSRTHKHADHLSFVWHDRGAEVLIDPGRYMYSDKQRPGTELFEKGFWYSDPGRIYVERTRSHNCVEIDGEDYPRKRVKPFGSALVDASEQHGHIVTACQVRHKSILHWRGLVLKPGEYLLVLDWLHDRTGAEHDFRQYFQIAPCWEVALDDSGYAAYGLGEAQGQSLHVSSILAGTTAQPPVRGQIKPEMLGWRSDRARSLVPTPTICIEQLGLSSANFATVFSLTGPIETAEGWSRTNRSLSAGRISWRSGGKRVRLRLRRDLDFRLWIECI